MHSPRIFISLARLWYVGRLTKMPETIEVIVHENNMAGERSQKLNALSIPREILLTKK